MTSDHHLASFEALYDASVDMVYSYARARLGPDEAEDVASEVFAAALVALQAGRAESVSEPWLMAVTRNKVIDRWRQADRRMGKLHLLRPTTGTVEAHDDGNETTDRMLLALDEISPSHRALLTLHYVDGHPMTEVAQILEMTVTAARSGIARARRALQRSFEEVSIGV